MKINTTYSLYIQIIQTKTNQMLFQGNTNISKGDAKLPGNLENIARNLIPQEYLIKISKNPVLYQLAYSVSRDGKIDAPRHLIGKQITNPTKM